jgi:transposase-like protein
MQMLHPHHGSIQQYMEQVEDPDRGRPSSCPQCRSKERLKAHGFYSRTIVDEAFDGLIRIRRYLCQACLRTVSLLPEWALPFMRFSIPVIARTVKARLMENRAWRAAAPTAPYQRGQHWVRRFAEQAEPLSAALQALTAASRAPSFISKALGMHLLGWGRFLAPHGLRITIHAVSSTPGTCPQTTCIDSENPSD